MDQTLGSAGSVNFRHGGSTRSARECFADGGHKTPTGSRDKSSTRSLHRPTEAKLARNNNNNELQEPIPEIKMIQYVGRNEKKMKLRVCKRGLQ